MSTAFWLLSLSYVAVLLVLSLLLLNSAWHRGVKLVVVVLVMGFYVLHYQGLKSLMGWPAMEMPVSVFEGESRLLASVVYEGDSQQDSGLYVWLQSLTVPNAPPRAHFLPYSAEQHQQLLNAQKRQKAGHPQWMRVERKQSKAGDGSSGNLGGSSGGGEAGLQLQFRDQPRLSLPSK